MTASTLLLLPGATFPIEPGSKFMSIERTWITRDQNNRIRLAPVALDICITRSNLSGRSLAQPGATPTDLTYSTPVMWLITLAA